MKTLKFLHRWIGFPIELLFIVILLTGVTNGGKDLFYLFKNYGQSYQASSIKDTATALTFLSERHPDAFRYLIPTEQHPYYQVRERGLTTTYSTRLSNDEGIQTLPLLSATKSREGFFSTVLSLHRSLLLGREPVLFNLSGSEIVAWGSLLSLALSLIGLYIWLPMFKSFRIRSSWPNNTQRSTLQKAHINAGVLVLLPIILLSLSGAGITYREISRSVLNADRQSSQGVLEAPKQLQKNWSSWLIAATAAMPDGKLERISLPRKRRPSSPGDAVNPLSHSIKFQFVTGGDWFGLAASKVYIDPKKSTLIAASYFADRAIGQQLYELMVPLHTGHGLTPTYLAILLLPMLLCIFMVVFGVWGFWKKKYKFSGLSKLNALLPSIFKITGQTPIDQEQNTSRSVSIVYASQTGNAEGIAEALYANMLKKKLPATLASMANYPCSGISQEKYLILIVSTQGDGYVPDDAEVFLHYLRTLDAPGLSGLRYCILALGDSCYELFCEAGKTFDDLLQTVGGESLLARVDCDIDFEKAVQEWSTALLTVLQSEIATVQSESTVLTHNEDSDKKNNGSASIGKNSPYHHAVLRESIKITGANSGKDVRHMEICLADSGLKYNPGDSLGIWFKNDPEIVHEIIELCQLQCEMPTFINAQNITLFDALTHHFELTLMHPGFIERYAQLSNSPLLIEICKDATQIRTYLQGRQILDVMREHPSALSINQIESCLRKITPRMYSIASSQALCHDQVAITLQVVRYESFAQTHLGGATGYLAERMRVGDKLSVFVEANKHFRLPKDPDVPIIMVGPGTGVAPFRAFMQERKLQNSKGENWLFFGNPNSSDDFLYQCEWEDHVRTGLLTHLDLAFSRDQKHKIYVQHQMKKQASKLFEWLQNGAHFYLCGDAGSMANDVHNTLLDIIQHQGNLTMQQATAYVADLRQNKRYQKDVY